MKGCVIMKRLILLLVIPVFENAYIFRQHPGVAERPKSTLFNPQMCLKKPRIFLILLFILL